MKKADLDGIAHAQRATRAVIQDVARTVKPGVREIDVADAIEAGLVKSGTRSWLHTPYVWWGERTRFDGFRDWMPDALPTARVLQEGEVFILDAAPVIGGYPGDYAFSGIAGAEGPSAAPHAELLSALAEFKTALPAWARQASSGAALFGTVGEAVAAKGLDPIHPLYPSNVLGHLFGRIPRWMGWAPRVGDGFQFPILGAYLRALVLHRVAGAPYPFIHPRAHERAVGAFAVEPHLGKGKVGAKFESILLIDGDETRWLDPGLFGDIA